MNNVTFPGKSMTGTERYIALKPRIQKAQNVLIGMKKEVEMLRKRYDELVAECAALGIDDVSDLPARLAEVIQRRDALLAKLEIKVSELEAKMKG